ncbi:MAG TPA: DsbE family thiol:disulfide interchange protein [Thermoanaerobaculia bacterium]|nr:DsbE family thiol:disulfide interchange protein [Thermoanaerobaculia bacterium]
MNRRVLLIGLAVVLPVIALLVMSLGRNPHKVQSPLIGKQAPNFALRSAGSEETLDLAALRGAPVVINFWATWCVPCYQEHGVLTEGARSMPGVRFLGVVYDDEESKALQFLRQYGSSYPSLMDNQGKTAIAYGVYGVPETFFLDASGRIVAKHEGPLTPELLMANVEKASGAPEFPGKG